jgi:hypothetical protein
MVITTMTAELATPEFVAARPRALQAAYALAGARSVAGIQCVRGGELRPLTGRTAARTDVFVPAPGLQPGGHPA